MQGLHFSFLLRCNNGWMGTNCDECIPMSGCLNGGCKREEPFTCQCQEGWLGPQCDCPQCNKSILFFLYFFFFLFSFFFQQPSPFNWSLNQVSYALNLYKIKKRCVFFSVFYYPPSSGIASFFIGGGGPGGGVIYKFHYIKPNTNECFVIGSLRLNKYFKLKKKLKTKYTKYLKN